MKDELQKRIEERAYALWEADGRVHGKAQDYWLRAEGEVMAELSGDKAAAAPIKETKPRKASAPRKPAAKKTATAAKDEDKPATKATPAKKPATRKAPAKTAAKPAAPKTGA